jgi:DNA-binding NtrC family response regulator
MMLDAIQSRSPAFSSVLALVRRVAPAETNILITGETGAGKDFVAELIHNAGPRRNHPFLKIDCASIPSSLAESEFFGYEKGAFSDAYQSKPGKLQLAEGGTLYLDGVHHLSPTVQSKLLRFVQEHTLEPLGGSRSIRVDCRILSSVTAPLNRRLQEKQLREDLYFRLAGVTIEVPPLRERIPDLETLLDQFVREFNEKYRKGAEFNPEALRILKQYNWPGNIRELRNVAEGAVIRSNGIVTPMDLTLNRGVSGADFLSHASGQALSLEDMERMYILEVLRSVNGHFGQAARILNINRKTLLMKRRKYGIE